MYFWDYYLATQVNIILYYTEPKLIAQVCEVNKGLLSVSKIAKSGHRVVFDADGSYIEDKRTGESMMLTEKNGMYMLKLWTKRDF